MENRKQIWEIGITVLAAVQFLAGCSVIETLSPSRKGAKEYGKPETMVILTTERLRYEELYTEEIWTAAVDNRGTTFETALLSQVHDFLVDLKTMSDMAKEQNIGLTGKEKDQIKEAASRYYEALGSAHAEEFGLELEDMNGLYTDYRIAEKLVENLTSGMNLEVSDSEAKVIEVSQIELSDQAQAQNILSKVMEEGADFHSIAKEYSESGEIKKKLYYGMMGDEYEKAAFALGSGEISGVVSDSGKYYILKCENDYDEAATRIRKEEMIREKKNEAFHSTYQAFKAENPLVEDEELWGELSVTGCPGVETDFFEIYDAVCLENANVR